MAPKWPQFQTTGTAVNNWRRILSLGIHHCSPIEGYLWIEVVDVVVGLVEEEEGEVCSVRAEDAINLPGKSRAETWPCVLMVSPQRECTSSSINMRWSTLVSG